MNNRQLPPIPKMYLAQIEGRCSLQYTAEDANRQQWLKEWVDPKQDGTPYQHSENKSVDDSKFQVKVKFPWRVFSNSGQDSILRPVLGKNGIPFIPGSSIKGLFKRVCNDEQKIRYCGDADHPGKLRFHGAYPIGNWTAKSTITENDNGQMVQKTCYLIEDLVHPQQKRQIEAEDTTTASALISFYQPTMIFEFSSADPQIINNWKEVKILLDQALQQGLGGKTSTGYGFASAPNYAESGTELYKQALHINLEGTGVSSKLLSKKPEFRQNMFKAVLRGHVCRLLAGISNSEQLVKNKTDELFGSTNAPGKVQIYWENSRQPSFSLNGRKFNNPTYSIHGNLHISTLPNELDFINNVLQFAFIMGGFGKSWRRTAHEIFYQEYFHQPRKFDIGCHWKCPTYLDWINVKNSENLQKFLNSLQYFCIQYLNINSVQPLQGWRESWHPDRVLVYSNVVSESKIVHLFHEQQFKTVTAVGGRKKIKKTVNGREEEKEVLVPSSVWHRMLPLPDNKYLEIVTVFHADRTPWKRQGADQLKPFIQAIKSELKITSPTWGNDAKL